jgi:hypothetical protein
MSRHIKKESELIQSTNSFFQLPNRRNWYAVKDGNITEHNSLVVAMLESPDYVIFDRYDTASPRYNFITWYFDSRINLISHIPFGEWKLGEIKFDWHGKRNTFKLLDPLGISREVKLSMYFPHVPGQLKQYIIHDSFADYDDSLRTRTSHNAE